MSERIKKINDHLRDETAKILLAELRGDDGAIVTVTRAEVSPTLEHATIYISVLPVQRATGVLRKTKQQIFFLQQALNHRLVMRPVPKIKFAIDHGPEQAARIAQLLEKAGK